MHYVLCSARFLLGINSRGISRIYSRIPCQDISIFFVVSGITNALDKSIRVANADEKGFLSFC